MARKYARDNRGRFASSGSGATARGGRLKTASGNTRKTQTMQASAAPKGTIGKPRGLNPGAIKPKMSTPAKGSFAATKIEQAKGRSTVLGQQKASLNEQLRQVNAQIKEAGPSAGALRLKKLQIQDRLQSIRRDLSASKSAARGDTASVNRPMAGSRGKALNAEITRNVEAQRTAERTADRSRNKQFKIDQSRAKRLRDVHLGPLAEGYAQRSGRSVAEVKRRISAMEPRDQIKLFRQYVRENRSSAPRR